MASPLSALAAKRAPLETRSWFRQVGRAGPEVWVWPVAAACWLVLGWAALGWYPLGMTSGFGHHLGMAHSAEPSVAVVLAGTSGAVDGDGWRDDAPADRPESARSRFAQPAGAAYRRNRAGGRWLGAGLARPPGYC